MENNQITPEEPSQPNTDISEHVTESPLKPPEVQNFEAPQNATVHISPDIPITPKSPPQTVNELAEYIPSVNVNPIPVVKVMSPRGVEYVFLTIALFTAAVALGGALISLFNGKYDFSVLALPASTLLVSLPTFAFFFLRLKKSELKNPALKLDVSKRRSTQFIQITTFLIVFFTLIGFIATIFYKMASQYNGSLLKLFLDVLVVILIAGGILAYYWRDEHHKI